MSDEVMFKLLTRAKEIISDDLNWCQGTFARTEYGDTCSPYEDGADMFCSEGALKRASMELGLTRYEVDRAATLLDKACPNGDLWDFNDSNEHAAVIAIFERVLETT